MDALYNKIGLTYNSTRKADPYLADRLYHLLQPGEGKLYLDIGCGTGNYTRALEQKGARFYGVDPSDKMLQEARSHTSEIQWFKGSADSIPFDDKTFDGAIATLTIHHWPDLEKGFSEINRVIKGGSRFVILTSDPQQMRGYWLGHYFPQMMEIANEQMPAKEVVVAALETGFKVTAQENYFVKEDLQDLFMYSGKFFPERYFDENYRKGISPFATFADPQEVERGLAELRKDIDSGKWKEVKTSYENEEGDYLFLVAEKT